MSFSSFTATDHDTWRQLFNKSYKSRNEQAHPLFSEGVARLGMTDDKIPSLEEINRRLSQLSGWRVIAVKGLVDGVGFFNYLANKRFPVGHFIRNADDLSYTPAPDVFHDLYGHVPFLTCPKYANYCEEFGKIASLYSSNLSDLQKFERLFWYGVEFPLIKTKLGLKIFGGGILSSFEESDFSLSGKSKKHPFDVKEISSKTYEIDHIQEELFVLDSEDQLYSSAKELESQINQGN